jgi:hypothetical protein
MAVCIACAAELKPGQPRMPWFTPDDKNDVIDRGAIHLSHVLELIRAAR